MRSAGAPPCHMLADRPAGQADFFLSSTSSNSASTTLSSLEPPAGAAAGPPARPARRPAAGVGGLRLVHRLADLHRRLAQPLGRRLQRLGVGAFQRRCGPPPAPPRPRRLSCGRDLVAVLLQVLLDLMDQRVGVVLGLDELAPLLVGLGVRLGLAAPCAGCRPRQPAAGLDADLLLLAGGLVLAPAPRRCRWRRCRTSPRSAARRAAPAGCRPGRNCRAACCRPPSRARPGRP